MTYIYKQEINVPVHAIAVVIVILLGLMQIRDFASYLLRKYIKSVKFMEKVDGRWLVAVVTGADSDVGRRLVEELASRRVKVYLLCSNDGNGYKGLSGLREKYNLEYGALVVKRCDLSDFKSVRQCASFWSEDKVDILINNAELVSHPQFERTLDGHERIWQSNYLGHFLLTELLLPKLKLSSTGGRIINVSSWKHLNADAVGADVVNSAENYNSDDAYARSKLAQVMNAATLSNKTRSVTINACHPGTVHVERLINVPYFPQFFKWILKSFVWRFVDPAEDGAQTALRLALSKDYKGISGKYFSETQQVDAHPLANDDEACEKLYNDSLQACGIPAEKKSTNTPKQCPNQSSNAKIDYDCSIS